MQIELLPLTYEQIYNKLDRRDFVLVHLKETMTPLLLEPDSGKIFEVPEGYLDYDKQYYWRNI